MPSTEARHERVPPPVDTASVAPELRAMVPALHAQMRELGRPDLEGLQTARRLLTAPAPLERPAWQVQTIPGPGGDTLRVIVVQPRAHDGRPKPALLHTHGGGFITGSAMGSLRYLQEIVAGLDCVAVSVDYRLAPETRFPGALEDNYAALRWLHANADELGVDRSRIALLGESAGGGHAAMLAIAARDRGEIPIAFQALVYPMLDDRTGSTRPVPLHVGTLVWNAELNTFGWSCLLGQPAGGEAVPAGAVPARSADLRGLPPTYIAVGSLDLFARESLEYAQRLIEADVPVELQLVPGAFHAFDAVAPDAEISHHFRSTLRRALARGWGATTSHGACHA